MEKFLCQQGKIAGAGGNVEYMPWTVLAQFTEGVAAPVVVDTQGEGSVQLVITGSNLVEHLFHLFILRVLAIIGIHMLHLVAHSFRYSMICRSMRAARSAASAFTNFSPTIFSYSSM